MKTEVKKQRSEIRNQISDIRGITLIALIITIVIMLILVAVTVDLSIKGDLFKSAGNAVKKTNEKVGQTQDRVDELMGTLTEIEQNQCEHEWGEWEIKKEATEEDKGSKTRTCSKCGATENKEIPVKIDLVIGAYIEGYDPSIAENGGTINTSYTSLSSANGYEDNTFTVESITKWRILGEEEGQIIITPATPIKVDGYYLKGQAGYVNCIDELNKISSIYGQGKYADTSKYSYNLGETTITSGGRSIKLEDTGFTSNTTLSTKTYTKNASDGYIYVDGTKGSYTTFTYWGEDALPSQGAEWKTLESGENVTMASYEHSSLSLMTSLQTEMIYKDETGTDTSYWVGTRKVIFFGNEVRFSTYAVHEHVYLLSQIYHASISSCLPYNHGVRPAVYLKSDIQLEYNEETGTYTIM